MNFKKEENCVLLPHLSGMSCICILNTIGKVFNLLAEKLPLCLCCCERIKYDIFIR